MTDAEHNAQEYAAGRLTDAHIAHALRIAQRRLGKTIDGKGGPDTRGALKGSTDYVLGIDVSHHNGPIDWALVRDAGYVFAWIKATQGRSFVDNRAAQNAAGAQAAGAQAAGVRVGYYHFLDVDSGSASEQANHFLDTIAGYAAPGLPHVLDVEDDNPPDRALYTRLCEQYMRLVGGMVYTSARVQRAALSSSHTLGRYGLWAKRYSTELPEVPVGWADWDVWQHTSKGVIPGMEKNPNGTDRYFDLNKARPEWYSTLDD